MEPRPPTSWPSSGAIQCENLVIRYAVGRVIWCYSSIPDFCSYSRSYPTYYTAWISRSFQEKKYWFPLIYRGARYLPSVQVGILGRTGSGKSTLALSFFRFVEATEGRILVDGLDIAQVGLTDLRSKLTIIPRKQFIVRVRAYMLSFISRGSHNIEWKSAIYSRCIRRVSRCRDSASNLSHSYCLCLYDGFSLSPFAVCTWFLQMAPPKKLRTLWMLTYSAT